MMQQKKASEWRFAVKNRSSASRMSFSAAVAAAGTGEAMSFTSGSRSSAESSFERRLGQLAPEPGARYNR